MYVPRKYLQVHLGLVDSIHLFLHTPFFSVSFAHLHFGGMAKIDCLAEDAYTI